MNNAINSPVIVALDNMTKDASLALADQLDPALCRLKVGKELYTRCGPEIVKALHQRQFEVFLDLKFHDIPIPLHKQYWLRLSLVYGWSTSMQVRATMRCHWQNSAC